MPSAKPELRRCYHYPADRIHYPGKTSQTWPRRWLMFIKQKSVHEFEALKTALIAGGTTTESINTLINANAPLTPPSNNDSGINNIVSPRTHANHTSSPRSQTFTSTLTATPIIPRSRIDRADTETSNHTSPWQRHWRHESETFSTNTQNHNSLRFGSRSITLKGIPASATLADVFSVIKGGAVLDLFLRSHAQSAHISFVDPVAAENFIDYVGKNNVRVNGNRVSLTAPTVER